MGEPSSTKEYRNRTDILYHFMGVSLGYSGDMMMISPWGFYTDTPKLVDGLGQNSQGFFIPPSCWEMTGEQAVACCRVWKAARLLNIAPRKLLD